jgi:hypothetical protein
MRIPEVQKRLRELAKEANIRELAILADALARRPQVKGPKTSRPVTDEVRRKVLSLRETTDFSQQKIGELVGINGGRVSEILHGHRA